MSTTPSAKGVSPFQDVIASMTEALGRSPTEAAKEQLSAALRMVEMTEKAQQGLKQGIQELAMGTHGIAAAASDDKITAHAFWWGFHIRIPEKPLKDIETASDVAKAVTGAIGTGFGAAGVPPVAIMIGVIVAVWSVMGFVIKGIDQGKGIYLSWTWLQVPAMLAAPAAAMPVPTAIV